MNKQYTFFFANFEDLFVYIVQNCEFRAINSAPAAMYKELDRMDTSFLQLLQYKCKYTNTNAHIQIYK